MRLGLLAGNEAIKALRRSAFWITTLSLLAFVVIFNGAEWWQASQGLSSFALPGAWPTVMGNSGPLLPLFSAVLVILLIGSEFTWKTARQNVIDGLSRDEFFAGKVLVLMAVPLSYTAVNLLVGGAFALASGLDGTLVRTADLGQMVGAALTATGISSIAFLAAFSSRSNGAAVGLFFLWFAIVEQVVSGLLVRFLEWGDAVVRWLPGQFFIGLQSRGVWDPEARAAAVEGAAGAGRPAPEFLDPGVAVGGGVLWIVALVALAWWIDRRRDL